MTKARTIPAGEFKNSCLKVIEEVRRDGIPVTVTRRGKPMVRIVPVGDSTSLPSFEGTIVHEDESIYSTGEKFDADK